MKKVFFYLLLLTCSVTWGAEQEQDPKTKLHNALGKFMDFSEVDRVAFIASIISDNDSQDYFSKLDYRPFVMLATTPNEEERVIAKLLAEDERFKPYGRCAKWIEQAIFCSHNTEAETVRFIKTITDIVGDIQIDQFFEDAKKTAGAQATILECLNEIEARQKSKAESRNSEGKEN